MKSLLIVLFLVGISTAAHAEEIAVCREPIGHAYYHYAGLSDKKGSGWIQDKIGGGAFSLVQATDGSFDILFVDIRKSPVSSVQDGALIRLLRRGAESLTLIVIYPGAVTEIYSLFRERDGHLRFTLMQNKTGDAAMFPKSSVMVGDCDRIKFDSVK